MAPNERPPAGGRQAWVPLAAATLAAADLAFPPLDPVCVVAAIAILGVRWRACRKTLALMALGSALVTGAAQVHLTLEKLDWAPQARARIATRLRALETRKEALVSLLLSSADRVAALPEAGAALAGDPTVLAPLFGALEGLSGGLREPPSLAVHTARFSTLAWTGRIADLDGFQGIVPLRRDVFVLEGSVSKTLVATAPILDAEGRTRGLATAEIPVVVQRNIRNQFLGDFDLLAGRDPTVTIKYLDIRDEGGDVRPYPPLPPDAIAQEALLRAPDGSILAAVRVTSTGPDQVTREISLAYRRVVSALVSFTFIVWGVVAFSEPGRRRARLALSATAMRFILLALGPPWPEPSSPLLSPDVYASTLLGPLLRSPLDLFLTAAWLTGLASLLLAWRVAELAPSPTPWRGFVCDVLALPLLAAVFAWVADTSANCSLDLEAIALLPRSASHPLVQTALLMVLGCGGLILTTLFHWGGPLPSAWRWRTARFAFWVLLGGLTYSWPRDALGLALAPAVALFLLGALLGGTTDRWRPSLREASPGVRAAFGLLGVAVLSLLLYPSLIHFGEKNTRLLIEREHAPLVLRQPQWRDYVLSQTRHKIDSMELLEEALPGPHPLGIEELAFAAWSATDLAAFGFSSAVEIQDPSGVVVSRFALNLPSLSGPPKALPSGAGWEVTRERLALASAERRVLHARRNLAYHGEVHGAIHVYVGDDFWNLPFIAGPDPYSVLYRSAGRGRVRDRPVGLLAYDWDRRVTFSSADRPPALDALLVSRLRQNPSGIWTTLPLDGRPYHTFLFSDAQGIYGLCYPRLGWGHFAADLVEAGSGMTLLALAGLVLVMAARTLLRRPTLSLSSATRTVAERFWLRLFVAFVALAVVPAAVLQVVVRGFVADRLSKATENQALERAAVAKKAVEDYALFQRGESPPARPVTDAALVWVASLIRNDLDVFERGRLLASSKPELYASGLLAPRVPGAVFRALALDGQPSVLRTERIGGFSYLVVSVPVRLDAPEPGILSIPLALRQREVEAVLEDLDRTIRLASVLFLVAAASVAHSMARRISGPIRDLTRATQLVAHGDLQARVEPTSRDELRGLVESFNQMAGDLDQQRRELERSNRLAAWAEMARHVAHDVKNPLTPIQLSAEHLRRVFGDRGVDFAATLDVCTETILKQVRTLRGIVTEFSAFARPPVGPLDPQDLSRIVAEAVRPYQAALPPEVTLCLEIAEGVPAVRADRRLLERAVVNLLENALQAVGDRGLISVRLRSADSGGRVEIEVEDSGAGIDPDVKDRVFEPFFSTKTSGSGLGLALVKKIAEDHGGGVALRSRPGETRAVLWLPTGRDEPEDSGPDGL